MSISFQRVLAMSGAILAAMAVAAGAFGAHAAAGFMTEKQLGWLETAARYQMYHSLAILLTGSFLSHWPDQKRALLLAGVSYLSGILLFCGSLYVMSLSALRLGMITPFGGLAFLLGWLAFAWAAWKKR